VHTQQDIIRYWQDGPGAEEFIKPHSLFCEATAPFLNSDQITIIFSDNGERDNWIPLPLTEEIVIELLMEYVDFAWLRACQEDHRKVSRCIIKLMAWLWLLEDDELLEFAADSKNYVPCGKPILVSICEKYGFELPEFDPVDLQLADRML